MFKTGDKISHPMHGAGTISAIVNRKIGGSEQEYYELCLNTTGMVVLIPVATAADIGVRHILDGIAMEAMLSSFSDIEFDPNPNWNKRYRENMVRIKSGDLREVATVIKSLIECDKKKSLSTGERKMLRSAKQIIISEMILSSGISHEEAELKLSNVLLGAI